MQPFKTYADLENSEVIQIFRIYIDYTRHENDLLNQRTTWFVTTQAALILVASYLLEKYMEVFGPFFAGHKFEDLTEDQRSLILLLALFWFVVCGIGGLTSALAWISIRAAIKAQFSIEKRWNDICGQRADILGLPKLLGGGNEDAGRGGSAFANWLPKVLTVAWIAFLLVALLLIRVRGTALGAH